MAPDLSYLLYHLLGVPPDNGLAIIKTFGLFLALAFFAAAYFFYIELKRKEREGLLHAVKEQRVIGAGPKWGNIVLNAIIGSILIGKLFYALQHANVFRADPAAIVFSKQIDVLGAIIGMLAFGGYAYWQDKRKQLPTPQQVVQEVWPHERIGDMTVLAAVSGVAGAKLFDILEHVDTLVQDPIGTIFSGGGLAIYGGLIVAFLVVSWYVRSKGMPLLHVMDAVAPALLVGYGVGRLGCHFSGDGDWGIVNAAAPPSAWFLPDWLWSYDYPHNVLREGIPIEGCTFDYCMRLAEPVYPTPIYETLMALAIAGVLWSLRKRLNVPGMLFALYLIFNGVERFFIEKIRVNKQYDFGAIQATQAEIISVLFVIAGLIMAYVLWQQYRKSGQGNNS